MHEYELRMEISMERELPKPKSPDNTTFRYSGSREQALKVKLALEKKKKGIKTQGKIR